MSPAHRPVDGFGGLLNRRPLPGRHTELDRNTPRRGRLDAPPPTGHLDAEARRLLTELAISWFRHPKDGI